METADPFRVLGLDPTLDRAAIKRAYFAAVQRTPPHSDPEAFRRVRTAYEQLQSPSQVQTAYLQGPLDADAGLTRWEARFRARVDAACKEQCMQLDTARAVEFVIERCLQLRVE
jgi:curved DNA-binding protein CbpA